MQISGAWRAVGAILAALVLAGCASIPRDPRITGPALTSPYLRPEDGVLYRYGNFCGAGVPDMRDTPQGSPQRIALLRGLEPVDSIDATCKAHDLCYEKFGHDVPKCDAVFDGLTQTAGSYSFKGERALARACGNLIDELNTGVVDLKGKKAGGASTQVLTRSNQAYTALVVAPIGGALDRALGAASGSGRFPKEPGLCHFTEESRRDLEVRGLIELRLAHALWRCSERRGRELGYLSSLTIEESPDCGRYVEEAKKLTRADLYR